jgi:RHS repeat-associated protein
MITTRTVRAAGMILFLVNILCTVHAQNKPDGTQSAPYTQTVYTPDGYISNNVNQIRSWQAIVPITDETDLTNPTKTIGEVQQAAQYMDGLGRPVQTISKGISPLGFDIVSPVEYDQYGREANKYMPYTATSNTGNFRSSVFDDEKNALQSMYPGEQFFYNKTDFEPSPLNRLQTTYAQGNSWVGSGRGVTITYGTNNSGDQVHIWHIGMTSGSVPVSNSNDIYVVGSLYKTTVTEENGKQTIEFKDKEGKIILKKVQAADVPAQNNDDWLCTYYVYDELNNLRFVLQPKAVLSFLNSGSWIFDNTNWSNSTIAKNLCFIYEYDNRNRMIIKKVPGAGEVYMVYDYRDRLVMTQDANMRSGSSSNWKWMYIKYDLENRPILTGLWTNSSSQATHQTSASTSVDYPAPTTNYEVLTETYYDSYGWVANSGTSLTANLSTTYINNTAYFYTPDNTTYPFPQKIKLTRQTNGLVTGTKTKILGTGTYLYTVTFYDDHNRVIQVQSTNQTGGIDQTSVQYSFNGQVLRNLMVRQKAGGIAVTYKILTKYEYDVAWRLRYVKKKVDNSAETIISENKYDETGRLKTKNLGQKRASNGTYTTDPVETLTYDYNVRGWLKGINKDYAENAGAADNWFGMELTYDYGFNSNQFNGNVAGVIWKSKGDQKQRAFGYAYDAANRLTKADFTQNVSTGVWDNTTDKINFSVENISYDVNGNITAMKQQALKITNSSLTDDLTYNYIPNSNQLNYVKDGINEPDQLLGDFKEPSPNTSDADYDYLYDDNGNLKSDKNKNITSITYNHLNLPLVVTMPKGTITYTYDAAGVKQKKVVLENLVSDGSQTVTTTTTYLADMVFESKAYNPVVTSKPNYTDVLQFIGQEEGRIRPTTTGQTTSMFYDYMVRDHLGNVRVVLTDEKAVDIYPDLSFEGAANSTEVNNQDAVWDDNTGNKIDAGNDAKRTTWQSVYSNAPSANGTYCRKLKKVLGTNNPATSIGAGKLMKVMSGDKINVSIDYYYVNGDPHNGSADGWNTFLASLTNALIPSDAASELVKNNFSSIYNAQNNSSPLLKDLLQNNESQSTDLNAPLKAFMHVILFDERFVYDDQNSYVEQVKRNQGNFTFDNIIKSVNVKKNGYAYIYFSNESTNDIYFDNLKLTDERSPLLEETHYYPYGLTMAGISSKALSFGAPRNKRGFNSGNELESKEFSDGSGLDWYDAKNRMYDAQLGRFFQIDPLGDMSQNTSPYVFASNNPISINDPLGLQDSSHTLIPVTVVGYIKNKASQFKNWVTGANVGYNGSGWGHGPRQWLANQLGLGNNANNLLELGLQSQLQASQVNLTGDLLVKLKTDPAMVAFQNKIITLLKADPRFGKLDFVLKNKNGVQFGGQRWSSKSEDWGALNGNNPALHGETWAVGGNALTWSVRHATIDYTATVKSDGTIVIAYHLSDTLDLSPQSGRSDAYNNISAMTGFMYHDVFGGNSEMKVNADWQATVK